MTTLPLSLRPFPGPYLPSGTWVQVLAYSAMMRGDAT
jgi:hypothetical protein